MSTAKKKTTPKLASLNPQKTGSKNGSGNNSGSRGSRADRPDEDEPTIIVEFRDITMKEIILFAETGELPKEKNAKKSQSRKPSKQNTAIGDYIPLPEKFTGSESWPKSCNLRCYGCGMHYVGVPYFSIDDSVSPPIFNEAGVIVTCRIKRAHYCSSACHASSIPLYDPKRKELLQLIRLIEYTLTGRVLGIIPEAPSLDSLIEFSGDAKGFTAEEYHEFIEKKTKAQSK